MFVQAAGRPFSQAAIVAKDQGGPVPANQLEQMRDEGWPERVAGEVEKVVDGGDDAQVEGFWGVSVDDGDGGKGGR